MISNLIKNFKPQIVQDEFGQEPTLYEMMVYYYYTHGFSAEGAREAADLYLKKVETINFQEL